MRRLVFCALAGLVLLCGCSASASTPRDKATLRRGDAVKQAPIVFMFGDSYTTGIKGVPPEQTYAADTARNLAWQVVIAGHAGTGFVAPGNIGKTFSTLYEEQLAWRPAPDMILVSGGHNDASYPTDMVGAAARQLMTDIKQRWPRSHVVLMGPLWGSEPPPRALQVRDTLRGVATSLGIPFIDPLQARWITGNRKNNTGNAPQFIRPDGTHPTPAGNQYIAGRLVAELRALGLDQPVLGRQAKPKGPLTPVQPPPTSTSSGPPTNADGTHPGP